YYSVYLNTVMIFEYFFAWHTIFLFSLKTMKHLIIGIVIDSCVVCYLLTIVFSHQHLTLYSSSVIINTSFFSQNVNTYVFYNNHGSLNMFCYVIYGTINITMIFKIHMIKYHTHTDFSLVSIDAEPSHLLLQSIRMNRKLIVESEGIDIYFFLIYIIIILTNTFTDRHDSEAGVQPYNISALLFISLLAVRPNYATQPKKLLSLHFLQNSFLNLFV
ncbi:hypothetical protein ACJX0J_032341, partial [Zea mays]